MKSEILERCIWGVAPLLALLVACGGSGSTGLIQPEGAVLAEVRRDGTCVESGGTLFCATDSARADAPGDRQVETSGEVGVEPTPCSPISEPDCHGPGVQPSFLVSGFAPGGACASASRPLGSTDGWTTGPLTPVSSGATAIVSPDPGAFGVDSLEIVLLCFDAAPSSLAPELDMLSDAGADLIFVPPLPSSGDDGGTVEPEPPVTQSATESPRCEIT